MANRVQEHELYFDGQLIEFPDGSIVLDREPISYSFSLNDRHHRVVQDDQIDHIAYTYYGHIVENSEYWWWVIAEVNDIENPLDLSDHVGQLILIPDILRIRLQR